MLKAKLTRISVLLLRTRTNARTTMTAITDPPTTMPTMAPTGKETQHMIDLVNDYTLNDFKNAKFEIHNIY